MTRPWTRVEDLTATLRRRWDRGRYLSSYAAGEPWEQITLPLRSPTAAELSDDFDAVRTWAQRFRRDSHTAGGRPRFAVEHRVVRGKALGVNELPARVRIETFEQLCALLGTADDVRVLGELLHHAEREAPVLVPWMAQRPQLALAHREIWTELIAIVNWVAGHDVSRLYLRHVDVDGVDTKFLERHQQILGQLLTVMLPDERVNLDEVGFTRRFGFRPKPGYTRFRLLTPVVTFPPGLTEVQLRTDELAALELPVSTVFVVENEVSYLAFPEIPDAIVVFGEGFRITDLAALPWLRGKEIVYWGDIDTHGFAMLSRLRARFGHVTSILMDHETLLAHPRQYVTEPNPTTEPQPHLTAAERSLYDDLIEDRFGHAVRLEQERVRFSLVRQALQPWR